MAEVGAEALGEIDLVVLVAQGEPVDLLGADVGAVGEVAGDEAVGGAGDDDGEIVALRAALVEELFAAGGVAMPSPEAVENLHEEDVRGWPMRPDAAVGGQSRGWIIKNLTCVCRGRVAIGRRTQTMNTRNSMKKISQAMLAVAFAIVCCGPLVPSAKAYWIVVNNDVDLDPLFTVQNGKPYPQIITLKRYIKMYRRD